MTRAEKIVTLIVLALLAAVFVFAFVSQADAQEPKVVTPVVGGHVDKPLPPPVLSDSAKLAIRDAQVTLQQVTLQMKQLEAQYSELSKQQAAAQQSLSDAVTAALKSAKLSPDAWRLDEKLNLVAVPAPAKEKK
jgi:hypothetical protein